jgi:hypothetical protein
MQSAWDRKEWIDVGDFRCPVLCLEMELLFNIAHLVQHQFDASLKHFLDIAGLLVFCSEKIKWDDIALLLGEFGLEQAFAVTTGFISTVMGFPGYPMPLPCLISKTVFSKNLMPRFGSCWRYWMRIDYWMCGVLSGVFG